MAQILCSTGALIGMPNGRNYRLLERFAPQLNCDGFEFMMYGTWYDQIDTLVDFLNHLHLNIPVMHCEKNIGEAISRCDESAIPRFTLNCDIARRIGAKALVMHLWDGITSDSRINNNIAAYGTLRQIAAEHDLDLLIENVVCSGEDPMTHWRALQVTYPGVRFVFDTKMAQFHRQIDELYVSDFDVRHYHINDFSGRYMDWNCLRTLPIGRGDIDFQRFFAHIRHTGYNGTFTVEATAFNREGVVDIAMLNECFYRIREHLSFQANSLS